MEYLQRPGFRTIAIHSRQVLNKVQIFGIFVSSSTEYEISSIVAYFCKASALEHIGKTILGRAATTTDEEMKDFTA